MSGFETMLRITALNAAYAAAIDDDRLEEWPGFFVDACLYKITSTDNLRDGNEAGIVYADSRAMLADGVLALRRANVYERQTYRHIVGTPLVANPMAAEIVVETPFIVVRTMRAGQMDLFATGRYRDRLRDVAGALCFIERKRHLRLVTLRHSGSNSALVDSADASQVRLPPSMARRRE